MTCDVQPQLAEVQCAVTSCDVRAKPILADQLTLFKPGGRLCPLHQCQPPGFKKLSTPLTLVDEKCEPILKSHPAIMKQARKVICTYESHFLTPKVNLLQSLNCFELGLNSVLEIDSCPKVPKFLEL